MQLLSLFQTEITQHQTPRIKTPLQPKHVQVLHFWRLSARSAQQVQNARVRAHLEALAADAQRFEEEEECARAAAEERERRCDTGTYCNTRCNTLLHTLQNDPTRSNMLPNSRVYCNTLQGCAAAEERTRK